MWHVNRWYSVVAGRKRFALVDTLGLLLAVVVLPADTGERAGAQQLLTTAREKYPTLQVVWADGGYAGEKFSKW
ncbi:MAG: transposase, partial [Hymenobacteraceae bacterium]|nr:transposase [Hymenobacteraceae bacterium]